MKKVFLVVSSWSLNEIDANDNNHDCYEINIVTESYTRALRTFDNIVTDVKYQYNIENCIEYIHNLDNFFIKDKKDNWFKCVISEKEIS